MVQQNKDYTGLIEKFKILCTHPLLIPRHCRNRRLRSVTAYAPQDRATGRNYLKIKFYILLYNSTTIKKQRL